MDRMDRIHRTLSNFQSGVYWDRNCRVERSVMGTGACKGWVPIRRTAEGINHGGVMVTLQD